MLFRCPECRTRRKDYTLFVRHVKESGHKVCTCGGYHYAHRPGTTLCHKNPMSVLLEAQARGEPEEVLQEIRQWLALQKPE
jgi:hypothetical protein